MERAGEFTQERSVTSQTSLTPFDELVILSLQVNLQQIPSGWGTFTCSSHNYTGSWVGGLRAGRGVTVFSNGDTYTGQWEGDLRHGQGHIAWITGRTYRSQVTVGNQGAWPSNFQGVSPKSATC